MINKRIITLSIVVLAAVYAASCGYLYFFQRSILYLPDTHLELPEKYNLPEAKAIKIKTIDNVELTGWYIEPKQNKPILVYFHGNRLNLAKRANKFKDFANAGFGLLAISYRGFGDSGGSPSEDGLYKDARAAINYLESKGIKAKGLVLYGESLGSGVAVQMALENDFRAIILEAPYDSIGARAAELYPIFPVQAILKDKFNSIEKIGKIHTPLLVFHSKDDDVMPINHAIKLFEAGAEPKKLVIFEHAGHGGFDYQELSKLMINFINN